MRNKPEQTLNTSTTATYGCFRFKNNDLLLRCIAPEGAMKYPSRHDSSFFCRWTTADSNLKRVIWQRTLQNWFYNAGRHFLLKGGGSVIFQESNEVSRRASVTFCNNNATCSWKPESSFNKCVHCKCLNEESFRTTSFEIHAKLDSLGMNEMRRNTVLDRLYPSFLELFEAKFLFMKTDRLPAPSVHIHSFISTSEKQTHKRHKTNTKTIPSDLAFIAPPKKWRHTSKPHRKFYNVKLIIF